MNPKTCLLSVLFTIFCSVAAISQTEEQMLDKLFLSKFVTEKEVIVSDALQKVFSGTFFKVNAGFSYPALEMTEYCAVNTVAINGGKAEILDESGKNLLPLVRKDFMLRTEADAATFETALDLLFPIIMDEGVKGHKKINGKWFFIRRPYFDDRCAYIVTLDAASRITGITFDEHAIKAGN